MSKNPFDRFFREAACLFDEKTRRALVDYNLDIIRQSSYKDARQCQNRASLTRTRTRRYGAEALCGSVFHEALESTLKGEQVSADQNYWYTLFVRVISRDVGTEYYHSGILIQDHQLVDWSYKMASGEPWGLPLIALVHLVAVRIKAKKITIKGQEVKIDFHDPAPHRVTFEGTLDLVCKYEDRWAIGDLKTWGLWAPLLDKGSVKSQSGDEVSVTWDSQLIHYDWMSSVKARRKGGHFKAAYYFHVYPANLIPYKHAARQGESRGDAVVIAPAQSQAHVQAYEDDLINFYKSIAISGPQRGRPETYGKLDCITCHVRQACLGDSSVHSQAKAFADKAFDYLRETE